MRKIRLKINFILGFVGSISAIYMFTKFPKSSVYFQCYKIGNVINSHSNDDVEESVPTTFDTENRLKITRASCWYNCNEVEYLSLNKTHGYEYVDEVDIRVIVLTYNRPKSLRKTLSSASKLVLMEGETAALEIWIDKKVGVETDNETLKVARNFTWPQGITRVHVHDDHAGLYSQWMDTWKPKENNLEIALFVEDDVDISPYAYKYLRDIFDYYIYEEDIAIICLQDENAIISTGPRIHHLINVSITEPFYLYRIPGSWGCAPHPHHWTAFREWYHNVKYNTTFSPLVKKAKLHSSWYRMFMKHHQENSMWTMWYIYYMHEHNLFGLYSNLPKYLNSSHASLSINRKEQGLHFKVSKHIESETKLLNHWGESLYSFPERLKRYDYNGREILD